MTETPQTPQPKHTPEPYYDGGPAMTPQESPKRWKSIAEWRVAEVGMHWSDDLHDTKESAETVCRMLENKGYGGDGRYFPTSTRVEEVRPTPPVAPAVPNRCPSCGGEYDRHEWRCAALLEQEEKALKAVKGESGTPERKQFICHDCGWVWLKGDNGDHDCRARLVVYKGRLQDKVSDLESRLTAAIALGSSAESAITRALQERDELKAHIAKAYELIEAREQERDESRTELLPKDRPRVVCLCGSSKYPEAHMRVLMEETLAGRIVIPMGLYGHADFPEGARAATNDGDEATEVKQMLDRLHFAKIDASDEILVVAPGGYIGSSTKREIAYAESKGKTVRRIEPVETSADTSAAKLREAEETNQRLSDKIDSDQITLMSVGCTKVEQLSRCYLDALGRLNKKDRPDGFESWEEYHKHVQKTLADNARLTAELSTLRADLALHQGAVAQCNKDNATLRQEREKIAEEHGGLVGWINGNFIMESEAERKAFLSEGLKWIDDMRKMANDETERLTTERDDLAAKVKIAAGVIEAARQALNANGNTREGSEIYNRGHYLIRDFMKANEALFTALRAGSTETEGA